METTDGFPDTGEFGLGGIDFAAHITLAHGKIHMALGLTGEIAEDLQMMNSRYQIPLIHEVASSTTADGLSLLVEEAAREVVFAVGVLAFFIWQVADVAMDDIGAMVALRVRIQVMSAADIILIAWTHLCPVFRVAEVSAFAVYPIFPCTEQVARTLLLPVAIHPLQHRMLAHLPVAAVEVDVTVSVSIVGAGFAEFSPSAVVLLVNLIIEALTRALSDFLAGQTLPHEAVVAMNSLVLEVIHIAELAPLYPRHFSYLTALPYSRHAILLPPCADRMVIIIHHPMIRTHELSATRVRRQSHLDG